MRHKNKRKKINNPTSVDKNKNAFNNTNPIYPKKTKRDLETGEYQKRLLHAIISHNHAVLSGKILQHPKEDKDYLNAILEFKVDEGFRIKERYDTIFHYKDNKFIPRNANFLDIALQTQNEVALKKLLELIFENKKYISEEDKRKIINTSFMDRVLNCDFNLFKTYCDIIMGLKISHYEKMKYINYLCDETLQHHSTTLFVRLVLNVKIVDKKEKIEHLISLRVNPFISPNNPWADLTNRATAIAFCDYLKKIPEIDQYMRTFPEYYYIFYLMSDEEKNQYLQNQDNFLVFQFDKEKEIQEANEEITIIEDCQTELISYFIQLI